MKAIDLTLFFAQELLLLCKRTRKKRIQSNTNYEKNSEERRAYRKRYVTENIAEVRAAARKYYYDNKDELNADKKTYREKNTVRIRAVKKKYYEDNLTSIKEKTKEARQANPGRHSRYVRERKERDPAFKILKNLRSRVRMALRRGHVVKSARTLALLGCSPEGYLMHIEKQFQPWMTWKNYGEWEIDHIRPCASFDLTDPQQQRECFHYSNTQPLCRIENMQKGARHVSD